ncbi:MAG: hypothetical protein ACJZ5B_00005 [Candidatus Poseidoniaceae archaeon]
MMANTSMLVFGGVFVIGGILTIPFLIGIFCAPFGCLLMLIGLVMSDPTSSSVIITQQPQQSFGYAQQPQQSFGYAQQPQQSFGYAQQPQQSVGYAQQPQQSVGYVIVGYNQYGQPIYAPTTQVQTQYYVEK